MNCPASRPRSARIAPLPQLRPGFTLIELLVALVLIEVALLGLSAMGAIAVRRLTDARARATAASAVSGRLERLSASPCAPGVNGTATAPHGVTESWTMQMRGSSVAIVKDSAQYPTRDGPRYFVLSRLRPC